MDVSGMTVESLWRRAKTAQRYADKVTTRAGKSAANDVYLRCLVEFFVAAGRLGAVDVDAEAPSSETRRRAG